MGTSVPNRHAPASLVGSMSDRIKARTRPAGTALPAKDIVTILSESKVYRDYERAFTSGTGLPLQLHSPGMLKVVRYMRKQENPFCALMAKSVEGCKACYAAQCKLESGAQLEAKTVMCFAGMCETSVPVRIGDKTVAFLQTGQVLLHRPDHAQFDALARTLGRSGPRPDLKDIEEAWFRTRVIPPKQYEALIHLIQIFARTLAACGNHLVRTQEAPRRPEISKACDFIEAHFRDEIPLATVARAAGMSANYFCEKFTGATGINFVEYLTRVRIEGARDLLRSTALRISEIAFEVGFQSLSQFNRAFRKIEGCTPRECRAAAA